MKRKALNIAEILKDFKEGSRLYSPMLGEVELLTAQNKYGYIEVADATMEVYEFYKDGRYMKMGECLLFPDEKKSWDAFLKAQK